MIKSANKILLISTVSLFLTGCVENQQSTIAQIKPTVISVPKNYFNCPPAILWPKTATLTDIQVAYLVKDLHQKYQVCRNSLIAVEQYLERAKAEIENN